MLKKLIYSITIAGFVLLSACTKGSVKKQEFELDGVCVSCPVTRLDSIVKTIKGVEDFSYNNKEQLVTIEYDTTLLKTLDLISALNDAGYDVNDQIAIIQPQFIHACCDTIEINQLNKLDETIDEMVDKELDDIMDDGGMEIELDKMGSELDDKSLDDEISDEVLLNEDAVDKEEKKADAKKQSKNGK